ncbi:transcriptional Coactivator p15-domain-containing protein [Phlebopus sp. FC_14]|nr:transcriptional Coactivator p15-domain-containing protein [Phlebopus sp. FC_14]
MGVNAKRKVSSDSEQDDNEAKDANPKLKSGKKQEIPKSSLQTVKKPKYDVSSSSKKASSSGNDKEELDVQVFMNAEGERYVDLGIQKRATVRSFKGKIFVDIREYFGPDGDEKPGKKGISLNPEQWEALKQSASTIDSFFADHPKK